MPKRILIVEDNPDNMKLATWILEDEGYHITPAMSGEECLTLTENEDFDLILMDISLPGIDGRETTKTLRKTERYKSTPIIALTAHALKGEEQDILAYGVNELITKPLDETLLVKRLAEILDSAR